MTDSTGLIATQIASEAKPAIKRTRKMARGPKVSESAMVEVPPTPTIRESKSSQVLALLQRPEGATLDQLVAATGWLPHTARAALTGLRKKGHVVTSEKREGEGRIYRAVAA